MIQDVFIIGATGKVGRTLVKQIIEKGDTDATLHPNPTRIVGLASSTDFVFSTGGLSPEYIRDFPSKVTGGIKYNDLRQILEEVRGKYVGNVSSLVFIDVTTLNEPMRQFHLDVMENTPYYLVTANKNPIALSDYHTFLRLAKDPRKYGYRCSVMAGAESITFLQDLRDLNERLHLIEGCFSGTNGYIATELEKGRKFSDILKQAKEEGYTEPDPRDDLSGMDVARKLIVLARTAGYSIGIKDVVLKPFIPKECFKDEGIEDFLERTVELDAYFREMVAAAHQRGMCLRYVGRVEVIDGNFAVNVSLEETPMRSPLGRLEGTLNKFVVVTDVYPAERPYSVEAPGAGLDITASNIRRDLLHLLPERKIR